jgi:hypothetical protein
MITGKTNVKAMAKHDQNNFKKVPSCGVFDALASSSSIFAFTVVCLPVYESTKDVVDISFLSVNDP